MLAVEFRFPASRYHATPWGRHVNEAEVEWPPSPWRILRALVATWHRKLDARRFPELLLGRLVERLVSEPPLYRLPPATRSHTRHYMPVREGKRDKAVLIYDAFVRLGPDQPLTVIWPRVRLTVEEQELLDALLSGLGFLGRAESWVEARRVDEWPGEPNCRPSDLEVEPYSAQARESVQVMVARSADAYREWRRATIASIRWDRLTPKPRRHLEATLPDQLLDALRLDSGNIKLAGWSLPPGARLLVYQRPYGCFSPEPPTPRHGATRSEVTTVRLALMGKPLPRIEDAVRMGELVRAALMRKSENLLKRVPNVLSGHGLPQGNRHAHAFFLSRDADRDGNIDYLIVHAEMGLSDLLPLFERLTRLYSRDWGEWRVVVDSLGNSTSLDDQPALGPARRWRSVTPYLHPWHRKRGFGYEEQILRECRQRGLPKPEVLTLTEIEVSKGVYRHPIHFRRFRDKPGLPQPDTHGRFFELVFDEPVCGPLALGFACHFGLGQFQAVEAGVPQVREDRGRERGMATCAGASPSPTGTA